MNAYFLKQTQNNFNYSLWNIKNGKLSKTSFLSHFKSYSALVIKQNLFYVIPFELVIQNDKLYYVTNKLLLHVYIKTCKTCKLPTFGYKVTHIGNLLTFKLV